MLLDMKTTDFLSVLSSDSPTPGGGGASAAVGAFASALGLMMANLTVGKKKYAEVEDEILRVRTRLEEVRDKLIRLTDADAEAFKPLAQAYKLPRDTEEEEQERIRVMEQAMVGASLVPLEIMDTVLEAMRLLQVLGEKGSRLAVSDAGVGILFAQAALEGASLNVFINTKMMQNREQAESLNAQAEALIQEGRFLKERVYKEVLAEIR